MTPDQITLFALFGTVFALLLWGRFRYDLVAFSALLAGVVLGVVPASDAFSGFGHPATLVVALVLIVSAGLVRSGAVFLITRTLIDSTRRLGAHIAIMGGIGGILSAFMNNVAALALLMPVDIATARKAGRSPGLSLMPLSFATILGGMITLIGTPPNIIIATIREDSLGQPFAMFDFAPVGLVAAGVGIAFVALIGWRLIPERDSGVGGDGMKSIAPYIAELAFPEDHKLVGTPLRDLLEPAEEVGVSIIGVTRDGGRRLGARKTLKIHAGDVLVVEAEPEALDEFRSGQGLKMTEADTPAAEALGDNATLLEVAIPEGARIAGRSAQSIGLGWRKSSVIVGLSRRGKRITQRLRREVVQPGDILLILAPTDSAEEVAEWIGGLTLADRGLAVTQDHKTWAAIALFAGAVALASVGLLYLPIALGLVVVGYVLLRILPLAELYDHVAWPVIVLLGSMIPLGAALEASGGTALIAGALVGLTEGLPVWATLTILMVVTMTLSDVINNNATAIVAAPVGITIAQSLGVSPDPFLMAVAIAASAAFLTPIGHQNNTLILGPGGYRFGDYWRVGLPLEVLIIAVSVPMILLVWPL
ncbi:SLC13 family permease [Rhodobacterales bacterium HKCCSP123]|nr:SLC13 family permease [Rhodobacterales bacterium HKCCSP123]